MHIDVWGLTRDSSLGDSHYFVTFIDDFSHKVWVYFMNYKFEVFEKFKIVEKIRINQGSYKQYTFDGTFL